jgi:3-keto-disaccharide hydrolase
MKRFMMSCVLLGVLLLSGCIFLGPFGPEILYEDHFLDDTTWYQGETASRSWWIEDGRYHVLVKVETSLETDGGFSTYKASAGSFGDFTLSVDAEQILGPDNNGYGVLFRIQEGATSYYRFRISGDGWAKFDKNVNGVRMTIREWEQSPSVNVGNAENHIEIVANGNLFTFRVNGDTLYTVADSSFSSGYVGFSALKYVAQGGELQIAFGNLMLRALE